MSGIVIESAYYGDERSFVNITNSLVNKITGGVLDVTADAQLRPTFEAAPETRLDKGDEKAIYEQAVKSCGGTADQTCVERTRLKLSEERLRQKENENLTKSVIKGDRLTLNIIDNGKPRKLITPAGQKLKLENVLGGAATMKLDTPSFVTDKLQGYALTIVTAIVSTFAWVFSIFLPYAAFMREYKKNPLQNDQYRVAAYVSAGVATIFPGAGYLILLVFYGFSSFNKNIQ